jgi:RNA polymerase sigma-70 factor (ECF subfamily)
MPEPNPFAEFIRRIRSGDEEAAAELVRRYEAVIRVEVRTQLTDPSLYRLFDSMDICQSVLASFFLRVAAGQYDVEDPRQLIGLLVGMARNKVAFQARKLRARRRDYRRDTGVDPETVAVVADGPGPYRLVAGRDLLDEFRRRLTEDERQVADRRGAGQSWAEIAAQLGGTPEARRKQLGRAVERVAAELGLDEAG